MVLGNFNLNQIRVFECTFRLKSMTKAAAELNMTQSGVSQHMAQLEYSLGEVLFNRIKQKIFPTEKGIELYKSCSEALLIIEDAVAKMGVEKEGLKGEIRISLPSEFGINIILPIIHNFGKKYPQVSFHLTHDDIHKVEEKLLNDDLDFAFIDNFLLSSPIITQAVTEEELSLFVSRKMLSEDKIKEINEVKNLGLNFFQGLEYVDYFQNGALLKSWFDHHYPRFSHKIILNIRATSTSVRDIFKMITMGHGVGILPGHYNHEIKRLKHNEIITILPRTRPFVNRIHLAYIEARSRGIHIDKFIQFFEATFPK